MSGGLTTHILPDPRRLRIDQARVDVVSGADVGATIDLTSSGLTIGSAADCDLVLTDPTVSSRHAEIALAEHGFVLRDLGSKNGVKLAERRILAAPLCDGLTFVLGKTTLHVVATGSEEAELFARGVHGMLVAESTAMRLLIPLVHRFAAASITVLVEGETGSGKEVVARTIHQLSDRADGPFVVVDCGAIPHDLIAAELFGVAKGGFTGAVTSRPGLFEEANGGTLFLDEIGELPLELQPTLLGAIERGATRRVGGTTLRKHDARIIAATNRNLLHEARENRFRDDLYFRLAVGKLRVPPLRQRRADIGPLAVHFAEQEGIGLTSELLDALRAHDWPGNVRELRNAVARLAVLPDPEAFLAESTGEGDDEPLLPLREARLRARNEFERDYLVRLFARWPEMKRAAEVAGVSYSLIVRLAGKHRLRPGQSRQGG